MLEKERVIETMQQHGVLEITAHFDNIALMGRGNVDDVAGTQGKIKLRAKFDHGIKAVLLLEEYGETWEAEEAAEEQEAEALEEAGTAEEQAERQEAEAAAYPPQAPGTSDSGRKTHFETVQRWRAEHPTGSRKAAARELCLSMPTIRRHWNSAEADAREQEAAAAEAAERAEAEGRRQKLEAKREQKRLYDAKRHKERKNILSPEEAAEAQEAKKAYDKARYQRIKAMRMEASAEAAERAEAEGRRQMLEAKREQKRLYDAKRQEAKKAYDKARY